MFRSKSLKIKHTLRHRRERNMVQKKEGGGKRKRKEGWGRGGVSESSESEQKNLRADFKIVDKYLYIYTAY